MVSHLRAASGWIINGLFQPRIEPWIPCIATWVLQHWARIVQGKIIQFPFFENDIILIYFWKLSCLSCSPLTTITNHNSMIYDNSVILANISILTIPVHLSNKHERSYLSKCPLRLVRVLAAQGSSNLYPLILSGPQEQLSLLPILWKNPLNGDFLIVTSLLPSRLRVSWWQLKY